MQTWMLYDHSLALAAAPHVRLTRSTSHAASSTQRSDGLAVLHVSGVVSKYGLSSPVGGTTGTALSQLTDEIEAVRSDDSINYVAIEIESPGGLSLGMETVVDAVKRLSDSKPTVAWINDLGASAGYWLAVGARKIVATPGALVGSVGTYLALADFSAALERAGIVIHVYSSGELKATGLGGAPITEAQQRYLEMHIREVNAPFIRDVKERRRLSPTQLGFVGDGRVMTANVAMTAGLIDAIGGIDVALQTIGYTRAAKSPKSQTDISARTFARGVTDFNRHSFKN